MAELKQTRGVATFRGQIYGLENENAVKTNDRGTMTKLNLRLKTDVDNSHFVNIVHFPSNESCGLLINDPNKKDNRVYVKIQREDAYEKDLETLKDLIMEDMENEERLEEKEINIDDVKMENIRIMGTVGVKGKDDEKPEYILPEDAIDDIMDKFEDGDSVIVVAEKTTSGTDTPFHSYEIKKIFASKEDVDFESDDFEETAELKDKFIFNSITIKSKDSQAVVDGYSISYTNSPVAVQYIIDWSEFEEDEEVAKYLKKNAKFGDMIVADCNVHNRVTYKEVSESKTHVGRSNRSSRGKREIDSEFRALQIIGVEIEDGYTREELFAEDDM